MEQEKEIVQVGSDEGENMVAAENGSHGHHSHHSSGKTHSSHSHQSKHSHHRKHKTSHQPRGKKPLISRIQAWIDRKFSSKSLVVMCLAAVLLMSCLLAVMYVFESSFRHTGLPGVDPGLSATSGTKPQGGNSEFTPSVTVTIPPYWQKMINEKTEVVKALQTAGGKDSVSFVWASDTHIPDNSTARTDDIGKLMAKMMDNCDIPFAVLTGDIGTRSSYDTEAELVRTQAKISEHLAPLWGTDRLLAALGNHDGCYGDSSCYYQKQFAPARLWQLYFRWQALDSRKVFADDGLYFYVDNAAQKVRFIVLNSQFGGKYLEDENGCAVNNRFSTSCYGQEQLDWLANVALDLPEGYGAIITSHVPPNVTYTVDKVLLIGIINAYCNKTTYQGSYLEGVDGWTNSTVNVDFKEAKGEIIAMFTGHVHQDTVDTTTLACPLITIISAGAQVNAGEIPDRQFGTDTETSFDVVTINRKTRTIYCTRVGAGEDREIKY